MAKKLRFLIIDDSKAMTMQHTLLQQAGHEVVSFHSCKEALEKIRTTHPDCIICDLTLPDMDGIDCFKKIRAEPDIEQPAFIIISNTKFNYDRRRAIEAGVDAYMTKPINPETFVNEVISLVDGKITIKFWGVRGTLPVAGTRSLKYGGNTNCVTLEIANKHNFIFDAGTGFKELSNHIIREKKFPYKAKIFITHPHYDHINGIPYFVPLYKNGNEFEFLGADQEKLTLQQCLSNQMDTVYFPVTMEKFSSKVSFRSLKEESFDIDDIHVDTIFLNHPGRCLGFRVTYKEKIFCYITDNELYYPSDDENYDHNAVERLIQFVQNADVLVIDSTYMDSEYVKKVGWGHSPLSSVIDVGDRAKVKLLCLYHHDPDQSDENIDTKLALAKDMLKSRHSTTKVIAPHEGEEIAISHNLNQDEPA